MPVVVHKRDKGADFLIAQRAGQGLGPLVTDPAVLAFVASLLPRAKAAA